LEPKSNPLSKQTEEHRESFRIDDALSFRLHKLEAYESSPHPDETIDDLAELFGTALPDKDLNPFIWKLLVHFDKKLDLILERLPIDLMKARTQSVNLSATGMRIKVKKKFNLQEMVKIKMLLPTLPAKEVVITGQVVRMHPVREGEYELALRFHDLSDELREEIVQHTLKQQRKTLLTQKQQRGKDDITKG